MRKFTLHWLGGRTEEVEGTDIADACRRAGIGAAALHNLDHYEENGERVRVACISINCGCVNSADEGTACIHDLRMSGLA